MCGRIPVTAFFPRSAASGGRSRARHCGIRDSDGRSAWTGGSRRGRARRRSPRQGSARGPPWARPGLQAVPRAAPRRPGGTESRPSADPLLACEDRPPDAFVPTGRPEPPANGFQGQEEPRRQRATPCEGPAIALSGPSHLPSDRTHWRGSPSPDGRFDRITATFFATDHLAPDWEVGLGYRNSRADGVKELEEHG
jgi:hypothetical protein